MRRFTPTVIAFIFMILFVSGCGPTDALSGKVKSVDHAVALLQDLDERSAWNAIMDGLEALVTSGSAFQVTVIPRTGSGEPESGSTPMTLSVQMDGGGAAWVDIEQGGKTEQYYVPVLEATTPPPRVYHLDGERYDCVAGAAVPDALAHGLYSLFAPASLQEAVLATLSVIREDAATTVAGCAATRYVIEARLDEALEILASFDHPTLKERISAAGGFTLSGTLAVDDKSGALSQLRATLEDSRTGEVTEVSFEVTQWQANIDLPAPTAAQIAQPCK